MEYGQKTELDDCHFFQMVAQKTSQLKEVQMGRFNAQPRH
jgi:hypothetical protein